MKRWILLFACLTFGLVFEPRLMVAQSACTGMTVPLDANLVSLATRVAAASDGDVLCLAAGSITYNAGTPINASIGGTVGIEIRGHGGFTAQGSAGETIVLIGASAVEGVFNYYDPSVAGGCPIGCHHPTIDNIQFQINASSANLTGGFAVIGFGQNPPSELISIIHHNDFLVSGTCSNPKFILPGAHGGLMYRNVFDARPVPSGAPCNSANTNINGYQQAITDTGAWWASTSTMGSADDGTSNFYAETNAFYGFNVVFDANTSSRVVHRFNDMHGSATADHGYDSSTIGTRAAEIYNNTFYCDVTISLSGYIGIRGGTGRIFNNTFPALDPSCNQGGRPSIVTANVGQFRLEQCIPIPGWPGAKPASDANSYPLSHQVGWGFITGATTVGVSTKQDQPGMAPYGYPVDGFQQDLEPIYSFNNTDNTGNTSVIDVTESTNPECPAMAYSNFGKSSGTSLVIPAATGPAANAGTPYVSSGQYVLAVMSDRVGGSAPTISDNCNGGQTWNVLTGTTNTVRVSAWYAVFNASCNVQVTFAFGSSAAARAGTIVVMRGLTAKDKNPAAASITGSAGIYTAPLSGTLTQTNEIVLSYFGLATAITDTYAISAPDSFATSFFNGDNNGVTGAPMYSSALNGTSGGTDTSVAVVYRKVTVNTSIAPTMTDSTTAAAAGVAGTITFEPTGNDNANLDLHTTDFIAPDREYYDQTAGASPCQVSSSSPFDGSTGTGCGTVANIPNGAGGVCTGSVGYWATDVGTWNTSGSGGQGVLYVCGVHATAGHWPATLNVANAAYVPYPYPHPLANVIGGNTQSFSSQPTNTVTGNAFSPSITVTVSPAASDSITLSVTSGTCTFTGTDTQTSNAITGVATFSLTAGTVGTSCVLKAHNNTDGTIADIFSDPFNIIAAGSGGAARRRLRGH